MMNIVSYPLTKFGKLSKKKKAAVIVGLLVLFIVYKSTIGKTIPSYQYDTVSTGTITEVVTETGNVASSGQVSVTSPATGILAEVYVKNGDAVHANDN
jgi:multidrug efflux pump subunit AcrA (membrane-fusion protein)